MLTRGMELLMPKKDRKGLLDEIEEIEAKRGRKEKKEKPKRDDALDLGKIR